MADMDSFTDLVSLHSVGGEVYRVRVPLTITGYVLKRLAGLVLEHDVQKLDLVLLSGIEGWNPMISEDSMPLELERREGRAHFQVVVAAALLPAERATASASAMVAAATTTTMDPATAPAATTTAATTAASVTAATQLILHLAPRSPTDGLESDSDLGGSTDGADSKSSAIVDADWIEGFYKMCRESSDGASPRDLTTDSAPASLAAFRGRGRGRASYFGGRARGLTRHY